MTPAGASSLVSINITGTGFSTTAANNEVSFVPASGATVIASATAIATVDATRDLRRITVRVPAGLPTGTTALRVRNTVTGLIGAGRSLEVIALSLPDVTSATPGTSNLDVRVTGSANTNFVAGKTQISFGTGITVNSIAVKSPTELVANIAVPANAALGVRTLQMSSAQLAVLPGGFTIAAAPPPNSNPTITSSPITVANEALAYTYDVNATDPDAGDTIAFALVQPPSGMTIDPATGVISWTPGAAHVPTVQVRVQASDNRGGSAEQLFTIGVAAAPPPNGNPAITTAPITVATEGQLYSYNVSASDPDGDPVTFALLQPPSGMTIDPATGAISWTPGATHVPTVQVRVQATDNRGGSAEQLFTIGVAAANRAPQITSGPVTTAREALVYSYQVFATDPNSDPLTFVLKSGPAGMTIDALGMVVWTPPANPPATAAVVVVVSDPGLLSDTQTFEIAVTATPRVNQSPQIISSPNLAAQASKPYVYDANATDADAGDTLTYGLVQPPAGMSIHPGTGMVEWTPTAQQTGPIAVTVRVSDGTDAAQQAFEVNVAAAENTNRPPAAHVGGPYSGEAGAAIALDGKASTDPDGDPLTFSWDFGDGSKPGTGDAPSHAYANSGAFTVTLTVSDGRGGQNSRSTSVAIGAAGDRAPPSVTLTGPREVLPGEQVTITAQATDNVKVDNVRFEVDGANPSDSPTQPFLRAITVPAVASPGTEIKVKATATDPSGNAGVAETTLTITARPDTEKPVVLLNAPPLAAPGATFHVSATARDNAGVQSVAFSLNGGTAQTVTAPPYEGTFTVPEGTPVGAALNVRAVAVDFSSNTGEADAIVSVVATPDLQPPTVQLSARATAVAGSTLDLSAAAADNRGIVAVDFYVDGVKVATDAEAPYAAAYDIALTTPAGRTLQLEARAMDFAGLEGTDSRQTTIVSITDVAAGALAGEVYNDTTGLPLQGVSIRLAGADIAGVAYTQQANTDARGRYLINAVEGSGVLEVTRPGWSRVDRLVDVLANKSTEVMDARLTPLTPNPATVNPVLGATVSTPRGNLIIPPGVLSAAAPITMTAIGQQGLQSLLPAGWTPVAIADVTPHDAAFSSAATLTLSNIENVPAAATLTLAVWDEEARKWRAVGSAPRGSGALSHPIAHPGQYAWLVADTAPAAPPPPVSGDVLAGVVAGRVPADATSIVSPHSKVVFYQPGVSIEVTGLVSLAARVPSGTVVLTRIAEAYQFTTGDEAHVEPYSQDIVLYQPIGGTAAGLKAGYQVTPSLTFEAATLKSGVITVELFDPPLGPRLSDLISGNGGSVTTDTGERADVPPNALPSPVPLQVQALLLDDVGVDLPDELSFVGGVLVSAAGAQFNESITLSISKPAALPVDAQILIARLTELGNTSRLVLVAVGRLVNDRIESSTLIGGAPSALDGIRSTGRYVFLRSTAPVGFATGLVRAVNGTGFPGALVSSNTVALFALSGAVGQYVAAAREGSATLLAVDTLRNDAGSALGVVATNAAVTINLQLAAQPPLVTSVTPANQAANVPLSNPIVITFSEPLNPATVTATSVVLSHSGGNPIVGTLTLSNNNTVVTVRPIDPLPGDTPFTVTVTTTLADLAGYALPQPFTSQFTSLDITAPPPPPAGAISATIPGAGGTTTVTGSQGTAGLHDTVSIINVTRGASTPVLIDPNGGFSVILQAGLTDKLQIKIVDPSGNATVIPIARFSQTSANGGVSSAVGNEGGRVEGPGGTAVEVPAGAFPAGTVISLRPVSEAEFPVSMTAEQRTVFGFSGGLELDLGGQVPNAYLNVSIPASPTDKPEDRWVVTLVQDVNGVPQMTIVDTARVIAGQIRTSSPPCPGVSARGTYGFLKSSRPVGLNYGQMQSNAYGGMTATIEVYTTSFGLLLPYVSISPVMPAPVCLPVLTGRVTVSPNSIQLVVAGADLAPADRRIVVKNTSVVPASEVSFPRDVPELAFNVPGRVADSFSVTVSGSGGDQVVSGVSVVTGGPGVARVVLDPDTITVPVTTVTVRNVSTAIQTQFSPITPDFTMSVAGGLGDGYETTVFNAHLQSRQVTATKQPSPFGPGRLVARAVEGTIDPTAAEMAAAGTTGRARTKVEFWNITQGSSVVIPASQITLGGFAYSFDGLPGDRFSVVVEYDDGFRDSIVIPTFRITVTNPRTGRVIRTLTGFAPPQDQPLNLGIISDDVEAPTIMSGPPLSRFDPSSVITFRFSEAMNAQSVKDHFIVEDKNGNRVQGEIRISEGNTVATFVPATALKLGEEYRLTLVGSDSLGALLYPNSTGMTDRSGNSIGTTRLTMKTYSPKPLPGYPMEEIIDLGILRKTENDVLKTRLIAISNTREARKQFTIDVTDPENPVIAPEGWTGGGNGKQRITVVPNASFTTRGVNPCGTGTSFTGDLAVASTFNTILSFLSFYDVTDPAKPCLAANKLLTATPETLADRTRRGTIHALGFARGVAVLKHDSGYAAYAAVGEIGLMAADIGRNIPEFGPDDRPKEALYSGDYHDVVAIGGRLIAVENTARRLDIFDPNLALLTSVDLPDAPRKVTVVEEFPFDDNGDGEIAPDEILNIAFVAGQSSILFVDITNMSSPQILGSITMPGITRFIDVDREKRRLFATGYATPTLGGSLFSMIDLAGIKQSGLIDTDGDGFDDRIIWKTPYPSGANTVRIDAARGLAYVGTTAGFDTWAVYDNCCDLAVDFTAQREEKETGERAPLLQKEKDALRQEISAGLAEAGTSCPSVTPSALSIIEQGSGACLWKDNPAEACGKNYQPGISDHDYEIFFPAGVNTDAQTCTIGKLEGRFIDPANKQPKDITLPDGSTIAFKDITFFAMPKAEFEAAKLNVKPPLAPGQADPTGDYGLGRQQLLLKWLLEGQYVTGPGLPSPSTSLESILTTLRTTTKIPQLEGYEWGTLQWQALAKGKVFIRVKGSEEARSSLHGLYVKQLHEAGKAGIRATLARLVAHPAGAALALAVTRQSGTALPAYDENACLFIDPAQTDPNQWTEKPCGSFEEYVASAAARSLRGSQPLTVFTRDVVVNAIRRFFMVKADLEHITSEVEANRFIALAATFVDQVRVATEPVYQLTLPTDPDVVQRTINLTKIIAKTTGTLLPKAELGIVPHLSNRGFKTAELVDVAMYTDAAGPGQPADHKRVTLQGGDSIYALFERDPAGAIQIDPDTGEARPEFSVKEINQTADLNVPKPVVFTIDLPEHKVKEANRDNNWDGFFYYVLDRANPTPPSTPTRPPLPLTDPDVLDPDAACLDSPQIQITQALIVNGQEVQDRAVIAVGQTVTATLRVRNLSADPVDQVRACTGLTNLCYDLGTLAPGQIGQPASPVTYTPTTPRVIDAVPMAYASGVDITNGTPTRLIVGCEPYRVVAFLPNPNPVGDKSVVMRGGKAYRWFRVVDRDSGQPVPGVTVTVKLTGANAGTSTYTTNADGIIATGAEPGMAIAFDETMVEGLVDAEISNLNGATPYCASATKFAINFTPEEYTETFKAGAAIGGSGALLGGQLSLGAGGSISVSLNAVRSGTATTFSKMTVGRGAEAKVGLAFKADLFDVGLKLGGTVSVTGPSANAGFGIAGTMGDKFLFKTVPLTTTDQLALAGLFVDTLLKNGQLPGPATAATYFLSKLNAHLTNFEEKRSANSVGLSITGDAGLGLFKGSLGIPTGQAASLLPVNPSVSLGLSGSFKHTFSITGEHQIIDNKLAIGLGYNGEASAVLGLSNGFQTQSAAFDAQPNGLVKKDTLAKETQYLSQALSGGIAEGVKLGVLLDLANGFEPTKLDVAFVGKKTFGWKTTVGGEKDNVVNSNAASGMRTRTYTVTGFDNIVRVLKDVTSLTELLDDARRASLAVNPSGGLFLGPVQAFELVEQFLANILEDGSYTEALENGKGIAIPIGFTLKAIGTGVGFTATPSADHTVQSTAEKGVFLGGRRFKLEDYHAAPIGIGSTLALLGNITDAVTATGTMPTNLSPATATPAPAGVGGGTFKSIQSAQLDLRNDADFATVRDLLSYPFEARPGPALPMRYSPDDVTGPAGKPHYGFGGFHHFEPAAATLTAPARMVLDYYDQEVTGVDESALAIYRWNTDRHDWDFIGGTVDPATNTVTTEVTRLGLYTLGLPMPAGDVTWTVTERSTVDGGTPTERTRVKMLSNVIGSNSGAPVAAGTLFHVYSAAPASGGGVMLLFGNLLTDGDAALPGAQVTVRADGRLEIEVEYPGSPAAAKIVAFADAGTAFGEPLVIVSQP